MAFYAIFLVSFYRFQFLAYQKILQLKSLIIFMLSAHWCCSIERLSKAASYAYIYIYIFIYICVYIYIYIYIYIGKRKNEWVRQKFGGNKIQFNLLKPTDHVMHQLYALPTLYLCVLYLSENKQRLVPLTAQTDWFL